MSNFLQVDDATFESEILKSKVPVLVDFSAEWCGPCKRQLPILEQLAESQKDALKIIKVDIDESPQIASKLGIRSVPTLLLFVNGQSVGMKVGLSSLADLQRFIIEKTNA